jgi:cytoskeletal protein CcmA (bactofilin family)
MGDDVPPGALTTIGSTVVIRGKLKSAEDLVVKGRIDADIDSTRDLRVENAGVIKAEVRVQSARISGVVIGNITGEKKVEIASDGRVVGDLRAPQVVIQDGAAFKGRITMPGFEAAPELESAFAEVETPGQPIAAAPAQQTVWDLPREKPKKRH